MRLLEGIWLDRNGKLTLQEQLVRQIKEYVQQGRLSPGEAMPSSRELANGLKLSRNTVVYAYDRLQAEGYLEVQARSGVFISPSILLSPHSNWPEKPKITPPRPIPRPTAMRLPTPFRPCQPDVNLFPLPIWNR